MSIARKVAGMKTGKSKSNASEGPCNVQWFYLTMSALWHRPQAYTDIVKKTIAELKIQSLLANFSMCLHLIHSMSVASALGSSSAPFLVEMKDVILVFI